MKDKIKNGYFFVYYNGGVLLRVGSRCYILPLKLEDQTIHIMFKNIEENKIKAVFKPNGERVE